MPMQIVRTIVWVLLLVALLLFSINNWQDVEVKIWENLILQTKLPALVIASFLLGLLPMWLLHKGTRWRFTRRINALENTVKAAAVTAPVAPTEPAAPESQNLTP
jgi:putative membrane protein